jgi:DNA-binding XRE family transcriptional regulator
LQLNDDIMSAGYRAVRLGQLGKMRERLGLSRNAMSDLLYTSPQTYNTWEDYPGTRIRPETAMKVGRFMLHSKKQLAVLREHKINLKKLMPLHDVAGQLGVSHELLIRRYREGLFEAEDLGLLGLWVYRADLDVVASIV